MSEPLLTISGAAKTYANGVEALRKVDLTVDRGDFVALLGASGCGKSTLLRLIAGLAAPSAGAIRWSGADARRPGRIGYVFQEPTLMPWADVSDNVYLPFRLAGRARAEATPRIAEVLELVGLTEFAHAYPRELSGGMKMRVSLARALAPGPEILLLDEPFAALDELTRFRLNDDLLRLRRSQDLTVLFVTHSVFESVFLANRVVVMTSRPGEIAAEQKVAFPEPRTAALRTAAEYGDTCRVVSEMLALASGERRVA